MPLDTTRENTFFWPTFKDTRPEAGIQEKVAGTTIELYCILAPEMVNMSYNSSLLSFWNGSEQITENVHVSLCISSNSILGYY